jgi:hypothetical protein
MLGTRYDRNIGVWEEIFQQRLGRVTVGIAGLGGSGGALVSILARNGFGSFKIADPDVFEVHNIQRQIFAEEATVGENKAAVTARAIRGINPDARVEVFEEGVTEENVGRFLDGCDFVHEVVDLSALPVKILLHQQARARGIVTTTAAMVGTGVSTLVFHPAGMTYEEYFGYPGHLEGWSLDADRIMRVQPDYLDLERFLGRVRQGTVPTTSDAAFLTGITTAGIYKRLLMDKPVEYAPRVLRVDMLDDAMYASLHY